MQFDQLCPGDRFIAYDSLWTKIDADAARKHSKESMALGDHGYGYVGDLICSFERNDEVLFLPSKPLSED